MISPYVALCPVMLPEALRPLAAYRQFITYELVPRDDGRTDKLPTDPATGVTHDAHDTAIWTDYETAKATGRPVGFVFTDDDPFFFLDMDDCKTPQGEWNDTALWLFQQFDGCAMEVSQSGQGAHVFGRIPVTVDSIGHDSKPLGSQFYTTRRFVALTGNGCIGDASHTPDPSVYTSILRTYFPPPMASALPENWTTEPDPEWAGPEDDEELISRMLRARSVSSILGGRASLRDLWECNEDALSQAYPDDRRAFNWSSADAALCSHLAFWTGKDCERINRVFEMSALVRDKWTGRQDNYARPTILRAVSLCKSVYQQRGSGDDPTDPEIRTGYQYLTPHQQLDAFRGCVYVTKDHKIWTPSGDMLKPEQFKALYGGYDFAMDAEGLKTSKNAWEAFTETHALSNPKVAATCFRPECPSGTILEEEGVKMVNSYVPVNTPRTAGNPGPFLDLVTRLLPDQNDREILLAYCAALLQYPGKKFYWCPLLQGTFGNGKSFIGSAMAQCVGWRYSHKPDAKDIGNKFNAWLQNKLLILVDEIYTRDRVELIETLKWMVSDEMVPSQDKGVTQTTGENRANFLMGSNHKDAVRKTRDDRRFCVFYTAQQSAQDIIDHGMSGDYFPKLYAWAKGGGYAIINHYLREYKIPDELNPAGACHRAPETTSTSEAIRYGLGMIEQEIEEAVASERTGFKGGWVSSMALDDMLRDRKLPMNKRKEIMTDLGYVPHPGLIGGRVNNPIIWENNRKPRLYVRTGHPVASVVGPAEISRRYCKDQGWDTGAGSAPGVAV